ncbi:MAG: UDP-3-O-(3-hydroxymyristoyl)glucosamine N-acyltransferase, partial [Acetobacteraceae bacterium]|nr:UDP-3-O-(3-hydroxymyristoyl)glucosamine N-acyltransferase [Acetobacteraceae bacterium]
MAEAEPPVAGDVRFFQRTGPHSLARVAEAARGEARGDPAVLLRGIAPLQVAGPAQVSFLDNKRYAGLLADTRAGAVLVRPEFAARLPPSSTAIVLDDPYAGWAHVAALFHPEPPARPGRHPSAVIAENAAVDASAEIGPLAVVGEGAEIGPRCRIGPGATIGERVVLGADCRVGANASLSHAILGDRVHVYPGARIGQEGFGFATTAEGFLTVPQLGRVILEDD